MKHKGIICGILAAVCYGTNPFGALPLYEEGVNTASVLFYRFFMAVLMLAIMLIVRRKDFSVTKGELKVLGSLGMLFAASSITYYQSFHFMDAGIEHDGRTIGDGFLAYLRCLYRDSQPVEHTHVIFETHVLCITDMHVVSAGLFIYFA